MIGLCPLLALAPDAATSLALSVSLLLMTAMMLPLLTALRDDKPSAAGMGGMIAGLACAAGATQLLMQAWDHGLRELMALGMPLVAVNLALWLRDDGPLPVTCTLRGAATAAAALLALGAVRELAAHGTLFASAGALFGTPFDALAMRPFAGDHGLLLFARPAGALFALALLLAGAQAWRARRAGAKART